MGRVISKSVEDTAICAGDFFFSLKASPDKATVVALSGDLGAGKTAFVKELGHFLGIHRQEVTSPTFVIMKMFSISHKSFSHLIHIDAYRLESEKELLNLGWDNLVNDSKNLILIEWPEMVAGLIPKNAEKISFKFVDEETREINWKK